MTYVLHDIHVSNSRLIVPHLSKSLMIGFPSRSMSDAFSRTVLRDYDTFTESITPVQRASTCSKVRLTFPLERRQCDANKRVVISSPIDDYEIDNTMFHSMTRHEVDFLLIHKFVLDRKTDRLRVQGMWIEFNVNAVDPIDLYEHNKRALESLFQV